MLSELMQKDIAYNVTERGKTLKAVSFHEAVE